MNSSLLNFNIQDFIHSYKGDSTKLAFAGSPFEEVTIQELLQQIEGRRKIQKKIPLFYKTKGILYPPSLNLEQTSSQATAIYKSQLLHGNKLIDITGGWGVDTYFLSKHFQTTIHYELNPKLSAIASHNFEILGATIQCYAGNGLKGIKNTSASTIYVDPARRHDVKGKVFLLSDCEPNVPNNLDYLLERCDQLLLKVSPMLDISAGLTELQHVSSIHCVAVHNEMKEVLFLLNKKKGTQDKPLTMHTVNLLKDGNSQKFSFQYTENFEASYALPQHYIYEPNVALLKSGGFKAISQLMEISKLHEHTHLYTSETLIDFPGRTFSLIEKISYNKKDMKKIQHYEKANITTRNFPITVKALRKKWKLKEGGDMYLFFTTEASNQKVVLVCKKV